MPLLRYSLFLIIASPFFAFSFSSAIDDFLARILFGWMPVIFGGIIVLFAVFRRKTPPLGIVASALLVWTFCALASVLVSSDRSISFFGLLHRQEGFVTILRLLLFFFLARFVMNEESSRRSALRFLVLLGFLQVLVVFWQLLPFNIAELELFGRPYGTFGNPNQLGLALLVFLFFCGLLATYPGENSFWRLGAFVTAGVLMPALFFANARGVFLGLLVAVPLYFFLERGLFFSRKWLTIRSRIFFFLARVGFCVLVLIIGAQFFFSSVYFSHLFDLENVHSRLFAWRIALPAFFARPLLGWGIENFPRAYEQYYNPVFYYGSGVATDLFFDTSHNMLLDSAVEGGMVLFAAFMFFLVSGFRAALYVRGKDPRLRRWAHLFIAFFVAHLFAINFDFHNPSTFVTTMIVFALLDVICGQIKEGKFLFLAPLAPPVAQKPPAAGIQPVALGISLVVAVLFVWHVFVPLLVSSTAASIANSRGQGLGNRAVLYTEAVESAGQFSAYSALLQAGFALELLLISEPDFDAVALSGYATRLTEAARAEGARNDSVWASFYQGRALQMSALARNNRDALVQAKSFFEDARYHAPNREQIAWALGETHMALGEVDRAEYFYRHAIEINQESSEAHVRLALFLFAKSLFTNSAPNEVDASSLLREMTLAHEKGFYRQKLIRSLWFADPFAMRDDWSTSSVLWRRAADACAVSFGSALDAQCDVFTLHAEAAFHKMIESR